MRKTDKKLENEIIRRLTGVCEAMKSLYGLSWTKNYPPNKSKHDESTDYIDHRVLRFYLLIVKWAEYY